LNKSAASERDAFRQDVLAGLSLPQKSLPCRWLYDEKGCELFERITSVEDYYPTRVETAILRSCAVEIRTFCGSGTSVIEYGAGAGIKTEILLGALDLPLAYIPIDIAASFLASTATRIRSRFPRIATHPIVVDFTRDFELPAPLRGLASRLAFFPGATIGNLAGPEATSFLLRMRSHVGAGGRALVGFDLVKDVPTLIRAYADSEGVTAMFNLNLLHRINRDLVAAFPIERFVHEARWNPSERAVEMHLVSLDRRIVRVGEDAYLFEKGETIHTESSRKYTLAQIHGLAARTGWAVEQAWLDKTKGYVMCGMRVCSLPRERPRASGEQGLMVELAL
jgi:dimethylhistidine N-methyltransferase